MLLIPSHSERFPLAARAILKGGNAGITQDTNIGLKEVMMLRVAAVRGTAMPNVMCVLLVTNGHLSDA